MHVSWLKSNVCAPKRLCQFSHILTKQYNYSSCSSPVVPRLGRFDELFMPTSTDLHNACTEIMNWSQSGEELPQHECRQEHQARAQTQVHKERGALYTHTAAGFRTDRIFVFGILLCLMPVWVLIQLLSYCNS